MRNKKNSNKYFGYVFGILFLILFLYPLIKSKEPIYTLFIVSLIFFTLGIFNAKILTPLNILWIKLGLFIGKFMSPIVMMFIFIAVVTPTGVLMRLFKKDMLSLKKNNEETYWVNKEKTVSTMKNQF